MPKISRMGSSRNRELGVADLQEQVKNHFRTNRATRRPHTLRAQTSSILEMYPIL